MPELRTTLLAVLLAGWLVAGGLAGCGGDHGDESGDTSTTTTTTTTTTTANVPTTSGEPVDVANGDLPPSPRSGLSRRRIEKHVFDGMVSYTDGEFDEEAFGARAGSVEVRLYRVGESVAATFSGLGPQQADGKCFGIGEPFGSAALSPYSPGACDQWLAAPAGGLGARLLPSGSLRACGGDVIVLTSDFTGTSAVVAVVTVWQPLGNDEYQEMWLLIEVPTGVPAIDVSGCQILP